MTESVIVNLADDGLDAAYGGLQAALTSNPANAVANAAAVTTAANNNPNAPAPLPLTCNPQGYTVTITIASSTQGFAAFGAIGGGSASNTSPTYTWSGNWPTAAAPGVPIYGDVATGTGSAFSVTFNASSTGTFNFSATVTASTGGTAACQVQISAS
jgi:hypothetical protein